MTGFFARVSPIRAYRDLRAFFDGRGPQEFWFLAAAMAITLFLIWAFAKDSHFEKEYRPEIIYVQQWKLDRTDAEIIAQQKIDQPIKEREMAARKAREEKVRAEFKKIDDQLTRMGI